MKKVFKILGIVAAVLISVLIVLLVLANVLITPERVRSAVLPLAREALNREIELGEIEISLFHGIIIESLVIHEPEGTEPFVAADRVVLRYQLLPLLVRRVLIDEVRLERPRIRIVRLEDGRFNFSDFLEGRGEEGGAAEDEAEGPKIDLLVSEIALSDGEILFFDHSVTANSTPYRYQVSQIEAAAENISLAYDFPFRLQAQLNGSALRLEGEANLQNRTGSGRLQLADLDVTAFAPYFREALPGRLASMVVNLDVTAEGGTEKIKSAGTVRLQKIDLLLDAKKDVPVRNANMAMEYSLAVDLVSKNLLISQAEANLNGIPVRVEGSVAGFGTEPVVDLSVTVPPTEIRTAVKAIPPAMVEPVSNLDPAGTLSAAIHLDGAVSNPGRLVRQGVVELAGVQATVGHFRPSLTGKVLIEGDVASSKGLVLRIGDDQANIEFKVANLLETPAVTSTITAERFALDPLLGAASAPAAGAEEKKVQDAEPAKELGPFDIPVRAEGRVRIGQTLYKGLTINDFILRYRLIDNVLTIEEMGGKTAGGSISQTARVDLGKPGLAYDSRFQVKGLQADPLLSALAPKAAGTVFGNLSLDAQVSGQGTRPEVLKKNLSGSGDLIMTDGKITGAGLVNALADFLNLEELRVLRFSEAKGGFTIESGKVRIDSQLQGRDLRMRPQGTVGLDGALSLSLNAFLSPELTRRLAGKGFLGTVLTDSEGWGQLPIKLAGTFENPRLTLDKSAVQKQVGEKARQEIQKKLQEILPSPKQGEGQEQKPGESLQKGLEETIRGIFGR